MRKISDSAINTYSCCCSIQRLQSHSDEPLQKEKNVGVDNLRHMHGCLFHMCSCALGYLNLFLYDYLNFLCAHSYSATQISVFNDEPYKCPKKVSLLDVNYPSIIVPKLFGSVTTTRTGKNVGKPRSNNIFQNKKPKSTKKKNQNVAIKSRV